MVSFQRIGIAQNKAFPLAGVYIYGFGIIQENKRDIQYVTYCIIPPKIIHASIQNRSMYMQEKLEVI